MQSSGHITFKFEGSLYCITLVEDDPEYFTLVYTDFWPMETPGEWMRAYITATNATRQCKMVQVYLNARGEPVSAEVQAFSYQPKEFRLNLDGMLRALKFATQLLVEELLEVKAENIWMTVYTKVCAAVGTSFLSEVAAESVTCRPVERSGQLQKVLKVVDAAS